MKIMGRMTEHKAQTLMSTSQSEQYISYVTGTNRKAAMVRWPNEDTKLTLYDEKFYEFKPQIDRTYFEVLESGLYDLNYTVNAYQLAGANVQVVECSLWRTEVYTESVFTQRIQETITRSLLRNPDFGYATSTNSFIGPILLKQGDRVELDVRTDQRTTVRLSPYQTSLSLRFIRPVSEQELEDIGRLGV